MKIAIIDSGIHGGHPHVGRVAGSIHVTAEGWGDDPVDRLGHGTAVAAAIREKMPHADLFAVKVFDTRLSTNIHALVRALRWCRDEGMDFVNLSLGTPNPDHRDALKEATGAEMTVVSAGHMLPGSLDGVVGVLSDESCPRDAYYYRGGFYYASPFPRPIPGVPRSENLQGVSFAVANMTGLAAQARERAIHLPAASSGSMRAEYSAATGSESGDA
jgi:subtilisin family serine protease